VAKYYRFSRLDEAQILLNLTGLMLVILSLKKVLSGDNIEEIGG